MHPELDHLISMVQVTNKPVKEVLEEYFKAVQWSILKDEWTRMNRREKQALVEKLEQERK